ncbi:uncharacterized protein PHALS_08900 [Plasmopara halstedii]|uniref:Uncharacterized protein n=1 Tax=Plasmopara halstedii TaxID=4781 RepID=A0A0P1AE78_PLAHL|nr:uncharacterized protein PHALS_08900 [Plasmopara halstedii]CEG38850.1 hypothetical protein PHALS_08900 [Plasmopara halstedii]|eukprot:XP_024575219.1 hypothetical protein PHALS_08900 [Plasmopara halstedii]
MAGTSASQMPPATMFPGDTRVLAIRSTSNSTMSFLTAARVSRHRVQRVIMRFSQRRSWRSASPDFCAY